MCRVEDAHLKFLKVEKTWLAVFRQSKGTKQQQQQNLHLLDKAFFSLAENPLSYCAECLCGPSF